MSAFGPAPVGDCLPDQHGSCRILSFPSGAWERQEGRRLGAAESGRLGDRGGAKQSLARRIPKQSLGTTEKRRFASDSVPDSQFIPLN